MLIWTVDLINWYSINYSNIAHAEFKIMQMHFNFDPRTILTV